ncbi:MAG: type II toxin-antitoxin system prevent-host-death family antitoxin [Dehalococcoidia bacterium]
MAITIGIRELRQHASLYLRRVRAGEVITVTDRGEAVAELRPIPKEGVLERLEREGRLTRAKGDLLDLAPMLPPDGLPPLSEILAEMREDER